MKIQEYINSLINFYKVEKMKTFKLYTFSQILTVKNCKDQEQALNKANLNIALVWKIEQV